MTSYIQATKGPIPGASAPYHVYVSGLNGSDVGRDGTDPTQPLATVDAALRKLPDVLVQDTVIHVGAPDPLAPYTLAQLKKPRDYRANLVLIGDGAGQTGEDGFVVVAAGGAAQGGSSRSLLVTTGGLVADALVGKTVEIVAATNANNVGARRTIQRNTTTNIVPCQGFPAALSAGDTWRVVEPAATFAETASTATYFGAGPAGPARNSSVPQVALINLQLSSATGVFVTATMSGTWTLYGVEIVTGDGFGLSLVWGAGSVGVGMDTYVSGVQFIAGTEASYVDSLFGLASALSWFGWGVYNAYAFGGEFRGVGMDAAAYVAATTMFLLSPGTRVMFLGGRVVTGSAATQPCVDVSSLCNMFIGAAVSGGLSSIVVAPLFTNGQSNAHGLQCRLFGGTIDILRARIELTGTTGNAGIFARAHSSAVGAQFGSANAGPGPVVAGGAYGMYVVAGGTGDIRSGSGATIADGSTPPATANFAAGSAPVTRASFAAVRNAIAGSSSDGAPVLDGSVISRVA